MLWSNASGVTAKGPIFVHPTQDEYDTDLLNRTSQPPEQGLNLQTLATWVDLEDRLRFFGKVRH